MWGKPPERRSVVAELGQIRLGNAPSISQLGASLHGKGVSRVGRCDALDQTTSASSVKSLLAMSRTGLGSISRPSW